MTPEQRAEFVQLAKANARSKHLAGMAHPAGMCDICSQEAISRALNERLALLAPRVQDRSEAIREQVPLMLEIAEVQGKDSTIGLSFPLGSPNELAKVRQAEVYTAATAPCRIEQASPGSKPVRASMGAAFEAMADARMGEKGADDWVYLGDGRVGFLRYANGKTLSLGIERLD